MQFDVNSRELLTLLNKCGGLASPSAIPATEDFLFITSGTNLSVTATDMQNWIKGSCEVSSVSDNGGFCIPAKILIDTLKLLPNDLLTFKYDADNNSIQIISSKGTYKVVGAPTDYFPKLPEIRPNQKAVMPTDRFYEAMKKANQCISKDELKVQLNAVFFEFGEGVTITSTDAHQLYNYKFETDVLFDSENKEGNFLVNPTFAKKAVGLFDGENVTISVDEKNAVISDGEITITGRLVDGVFPKYRAVIPVDNNNIQVNLKELSGALKRVLTYANKNTNQIVFEINGDAATITANDLDYSRSATEQIYCANDGNSEIKIGLNAKTLINYLSKLTDEFISIEFSTPSKAILIKTGNPDELYLLMPIMII